MRLNYVANYRVILKEVDNNKQVASVLDGKPSYKIYTRTRPAEDGRKDVVIDPE